MPIEAIKTDAEHEAIIHRIEVLWGAHQGTPDGDQLDTLVTMAVAYEDGRWPLEKI